jgi:hypothetical protein
MVPLAPKVLGGALMAKRVLLVTGVVAGATLAILAWRGGDAPPPAAAPLPAGAPTDMAERVAAADRLVAALNQHVGQEARRFEADGWTMVSAPPPDERLVGYDPGLLREGREGELRVQLASTVPPSRFARNVATIVVTASDPATREAAADALGRIGTEGSREAIIDILTSGKLDPEDLGRRSLAAYLRPVDLDDPQAAKIAGLIDHPALSSVERQQIAFNLALTGIRDGMSLPDPALASLSPEARELIHHMTELGGKSFLAHSQKHRH